MFPVGFPLAVDATRRIARSGLPDAPTLADEPAPPARPGRLRVSVAAALRGVAVRANRAAERVEPVYACGGSRTPVAREH